MIIIENEKTVFVDIDGTLIVEQAFDLMAVNIQDPLNPAKSLAFSVNEAMVRLVKEEKHRGSYLVAWSRGGYEWAATVIKAVKLENDIDLIMSKPLVYFDDSDIKDWLPYRVFLDPKTNYKR